MFPGETLKVYCQCRHDEMKTDPPKAETKQSQTHMGIKWFWLEGLRSDHNNLLEPEPENLTVARSTSRTAPDDDPQLLTEET